MLPFIEVVGRTQAYQIARRESCTYAHLERLTINCREVFNEGYCGVEEWEISSLLRVQRFGSCLGRSMGK